MQRARGLRKEASTIDQTKNCGQERMDRVKAGLKQATSGPKVKSGSTFTGDVVDMVYEPILVTAASGLDSAVACNGC